MKKEYPKVIIKTREITENVKKAADKCAEMGIDIMGVTKVSAGLAKPNEAYIKGGVKYLASSRIEQLADARNQGIKLPLVMIRIPMKTEIAAVVKICDISLQSELSVLRLTNSEAIKQERLHKIVLMADLGDLREGFWDKEDFLNTAEIVENELKGIYLYGIGTNLGCYGAIAPTLDKMEELADLAQQTEKRIGRKLDMVSVGGSPSLMRVWHHDMPPQVTNIRVGGVPFMPRRNAEAFGEYYGYGMNMETVRIQAEIVSVRSDRVFIAMGAADYGDWKNLKPIDKDLLVIGATDDLTFIDISRSNRVYKIGDIVEFDGTYTTLVYLAKSPSVNIIYEE